MSKAQTVEQDSSDFGATMDWLERKLTYNYFDPTNQQWWVNVIQKKENGAYTIKNIAAKHPEHVTEKIYHQRTFFMWDLNPKTVSVSEVPKDLGRFIKGKLVRLEGFKGENKILNTKDGRRGSSVSYIHISIPEFLEDSLQGYSLQVKEKLATALYLNARVFNTGNEEENRAIVFQTLQGKYISEDSTSYLDFDLIDQGLITFNVRGGQKPDVGTFGYDSEKKIFFYFKATSGGHLIRQLKVDELTRDLVLNNEEGDSVSIIGRNTFEFTMNGVTTRYYRY